MKKIFKFLPLALAGFALASCSSDDLSEGQVAKHNPNALQIVAESLDDADYTRAGAISASTLKGTTLKWNTNDVLRVYDAKLSEWDKYTYTGTEFGDAVADFEAAAGNTLTSFSLGAIPADNVEAAYMDKNDKSIRHLEMTIPDYYDYSEKLFPEDETVGYRCDLPMYGTITGLNQISQMNYLTAMVRVNMLDVPKETKYLVLVDESAVPQALAGPFLADIDGTTPPVLKKDAKFDPNNYTNRIIAKINPNAFLATPTKKDSAGIFLPVVAGQNYEQLTLYAVVNNALTLDDLRAEATANFAGTPASYLKINSRAWNAPARKKVWWIRYTNTCYIDTDVLDGLYPGHITAALEEHTKSIGELVIKPYSATGGAVKPLNPKEGDQFYHQVIIPKMVNNCKVTLDLSECGVQYTEALQIYRNTEDADLGEFKGDFKIIPGEDKVPGSSSKIEIKLPGSNVEIVSDGTHALGHLDIQNAAKTTIGDGVTATDLGSKTVTVQDGVAFIKKGVSITGTGKVIAKAYAGDATQYPTKITVEGGANVAEIDNNCKCNIDVISTDANEANVTKLDCGDVTEAINIYSEGKANIQEIICPTKDAGAGTGGAQLLTIKSKLTNESTGPDVLAISTTAAKAGADFGLAANTPAIYTAAQLVQAVAAGITAETYIMADELDLNNLPWVGLTTISSNLYGYNQNVAGDTWKGTANADKVVKTATGKNVIKNMKIDAIAGNGLIKKIDASSGAVTIAGIEFTSPSFSNTGAAVDNIGIVAGTISDAAANDITLTNIKVTGLTVASKAGNGVGGLVGAITAAQTGNVIVKKADVAATSIAARSFVGGIVGRVSAAVAAINIFDSQANLASLSLSLADGVTTLYPLFAGTWASFVGGTQGNPVVALNIYDSNYGTAINKTTKGSGINNQGLRFGANADGSDVPFFGGNPWIGFCGTADPVASNTTLTTFKSVSTADADKGINFYKYAYGLNSMTVTRYNGTGNYAETTQKNLSGGALYTSGVGANSVTYDGTNAAGVTASKASGSWAWKDGKKFGTSIYSIYDTSALDPDALGYDNAYEPTTF